MTSYLKNIEHLMVSQEPQNIEHLMVSQEPQIIESCIMYDKLLEKHKTS